MSARMLTTLMSRWIIVKVVFRLGTQLHTYKEDWWKVYPCLPQYQSIFGGGIGCKRRKKHKTKTSNFENTHAHTVYLDNAWLAWVNYHKNDWFEHHTLITATVNWYLPTEWQVALVWRLPIHCDGMVAIVAHQRKVSSMSGLIIIHGNYFDAPNPTQ